MTPPAASDADTDRRTVGDILLARGYISEAQLEHAIASQQASGKPLGQVLVEAGAITRLELASALAEQWSDTATWLGPPDGSNGREGRSRSRVDDSLAAEAREAGYTQQLQEAVVELARRVASFEPVLTDLKLRAEAGAAAGEERLLDRVEVLQDGVTMLSRRLDELTEGVERAFAGVQESSQEFAAEIERTRGALAELAERPAGDPSLGGALETLQARLDELTSQVGAQAQNTELDGLRSTVAELAARPAGDPALGEAVATLQARLVEVSAQIAETSRLDALDATVAELAARPPGDPAVADALDAVRATLDELGATVAELSVRPAGDPAVGEAVAALQARLDELAAETAGHARVDDVAALRTGLDEIAGRLGESPGQDAVAELRTAVEALQVTTHELAERPQADPALAGRLEELTTRIEALAGTDALEAVRTALDEIAGRPAGDPQLEARLGELSARLDEITGAIAGRAEAESVETLRQSIAELDTRLASLARLEDVEGIRSSLEQELASQPAIDPVLGQRVDEAVSRLDDLNGRLDAIAGSIAEQDTDPTADLRALVQELADRPAADPDLAVTVDALAARLEDLSTSVAALKDARAGEPATTTAETALDEGLREALEGLIADVARRADGVAQETTTAIQSWAAQQAALESRLEAMAADLAEARLQATQVPLAPLPPEPKSRGKTKTSGESDGAGVESELERLRFAVERINLHLGERERAISDLMRSRSQEVKVEDLAKRLAELEQGGVAAAPASAAAAAAVPAGDGDVHRDVRSLAQRVEEAEKAAKTDREKVLTQLERLASSIDWRFRRLESGDETA